VCSSDLDEPTSSLGPAQVDDLFATLKSLRDDGRSIVIVTHKLNEVMEIADRVTMLRNGKNVATAEKGSYDEQALARMMTGSEVHEVTVTGAEYSGREPIYRVQDLVVHRGERLHAVHGVSLDVLLARSSASPGWRATGSESSSTRSPASRRSNPARSRSTARTSRAPRRWTCVDAA